MLYCLTTPKGQLLAVLFLQIAALLAIDTNHVTAAQGPTSSPKGNYFDTLNRIKNPIFQLHALPKSAPHYRNRKAIRKKPMENRKMANNSQSGSYAHLKRLSDREIYYEIQTIAPSACYEAGRVFMSKNDHEAERYGLRIIYAHVNYVSGMCAQSLTPINFKGKIQADNCDPSDQALVVIIDERNHNLTTVGPIKCE